MSTARSPFTNLLLQKQLTGYSAIQEIKYLVLEPTIHHCRLIYLQHISPRAILSLYRPTLPFMSLCYKRSLVTCFVHKSEI
jgi:hypothetical protein